MHTLLNTDQAASYLGVTAHTLNNWRHKGMGPRFIKTTRSSRGKVFYRLRDIEAWQNANLYSSTSDVGAHNVQKAK